jgi:hypothetical protein
VETELMDRLEDARRALIRSDACLLTLLSSGQNLQIQAPTFPIPVERIVDENNKSLFRKGEKVSTNHMILREITVKLSDSTPLLKPNSLLVLDMILLVDLKGVSFGVSSMQRKFALTIETGANEEIISCNSVDLAGRVALEEAICKSVGGAMTTGHICDLSKSKSMIQAACESMGLKSNGVHCE